MTQEMKESESRAFRYIRNEIIHKGHSPSVRDVQGVLGCKSSRTALLAINALISRGYLSRREDDGLQILKDVPGRNDAVRTVEVPLIGSVSCGRPMLAEENIEGWISVSEQLARPGSKYFLLRASGDSMNAAGIQHGDLLLVRQQAYAEPGDRVVALINDEATVKEYVPTEGAVILRPRSTSAEYKPIILTDNFEVQGVVVSAIPNLSI